MKNIHLFRRPKLLRALLIILFVAVPFEWSSAQFTLKTPKATLGQVIQTVKSQSTYQFFYDDKLSDMTVEAIDVKDVSLDELLNKLLKGKGVTYKVEDNIVYLSVEKAQTQQQQQKEHEISGTVVDAKGEPLIGVNVSVQGATVGTITDFDGNYILKIDNPDAKIVFSYIGYKQQILPVGNVPMINVTLEEDTQLISEVVVTALGIKRDKKMLGYAVQDLKGDKLNQTGDPSVTSALQGKVAGLQMNTSSTGMGGSTKITLRGNSSLTDNNQPLWIVDGVPFNDNSDSSASLFGGIDRGGATVDINPDDIESISVLKGPNAAALYGSRAGNGVILITTKKGTKSEGFGVTYNGSLTWTQVASTLDMQDKYGQGTGGVYDPNSVVSFGAPLDGHEYETKYGIRKYQKQGDKLNDYFDTGFAQSHNVSVGNVTEKSNYRASVGSLENKGLFNGESMSKINFDLKAGTELNKYFSMDTKLSVSRSKANNRPIFGKGGEVYQLLFMPNNVSLDDLKEFKSEDSRHINWVGPEPTVLNPYYINHQYTNYDERWRAFGYYSIKLNFTPWLYGTAKYAFDYYHTNIEEINRTNGIDDQAKESLMNKEDNFFEHNIEFMLIGNNKIGERIRLGYSIGSNIMRQKTHYLTGKSEHMRVEDYWNHNSALGLNAAMNDLTDRKTNSVFGTLQFAWDEYLALDLTARNDWSSTLPIDNCSYFYPSANLSFVFTDFAGKMDWTLPSWMTFGKIRLSAAQVGKDTSPYQLYPYIKWTPGLNGSVPSTPTIKPNSELKPEISSAYEAGLDMKFFNNRFGFDFTYYYSLTKNQIMTVPLSGKWTGKIINAGQIENKGVELMLYSTIVKTKDFEFDLDLNFAHNKSIVKELHESAKYMTFNFRGDDMLVDVGAYEGGKLGDIFGEKSYKRDENGNILTRNGIPLTETDRSKKKAIGNIQPNLLMSVAPRFTYKGITLSALFDMKFGGEIFSMSEAVATSNGMSKRTENRENIVVDGIDETTGEKNDIAVPAEEYYKMIGQFAEEFIYDASFIRLKELSLSYSFPKSLLKKTPLTSLRLSLVGRNLGYLLKHTPGTSPEGGFDTTMFSQAIDFTSVPYTRTIGFSLGVSF
ncbi:SusC/RagA family TonB-linked outer membrane protein [Bacteroides sp.]